jgi:hypothetical protein
MDGRAAAGVVGRAIHPVDEAGGEQHIRARVVAASDLRQLLVVHRPPDQAEEQDADARAHDLGLLRVRGCLGLEPGDGGARGRRNARQRVPSRLRAPSLRGRKPTGQTLSTTRIPVDGHHFFVMCLC